MTLNPPPQSTDRTTILLPGQNCFFHFKSAWPAIYVISLDPRRKHMEKEATFRTVCDTDYTQLTQAVADIGCHEEQNEDPNNLHGGEGCDEEASDLRATWSWMCCALGEGSYLYGKLWFLHLSCELIQSWYWTREALQACHTPRVELQYLSVNCCFPPHRQGGHLRWRVFFCLLHKWRLLLTLSFSQKRLSMVS